MRSDRGRLTAELHSAQEPNTEQKRRFAEFLVKRYNKG